MSVLGLKIVRHNGYIFMYWDRRENHPPAHHIWQVPRHPDEYTTWLTLQRKTHSFYLQELETRILSVHWCEVERYFKEFHLSEDKKTSLAGFESLEAFRDVELGSLPSRICLRWEWFEFPDWLYFLDLDKEAFFMRTGPGSTMSHLENIPQYEGACLKSFGQIYSKTVDKEFGETFQIQLYQASSKEDPKGIDVKEILKDFQLVSYKPKPKTFSNTNVKDAVGLILLHTFMGNISSLMGNFWAFDPKDFAFKEVAFAILSLATGSYQLEDPRRLYRYEHGRYFVNGYLLSPDPRPDSFLMPMFGSGAHEYGKVPGCAPSGEFYWLQHVLVSLVSKSTLLGDERAAIARAVAYAHDCDNDYYIILFSISHAIIVDVRLDDRVISYSDVLLISEKKVVSKPGHRSVIAPFEALKTHLKDLVLLSDTFSTARKRAFSPFQSSNRLPWEVFFRIFELSDGRTRRHLAELYFAPSERYGSMLFGGDQLCLLKFEPSDFRRFKLKPGKRDYLGHLIVSTGLTGSEYRIKITPLSYKESNDGCTKRPRWRVVLGSADRPAMMKFVGIRLDPTKKKDNAKDKEDEESTDEEEILSDDEGLYGEEVRGHGL